MRPTLLIILMAAIATAATAQTKRGKTAQRKPKAKVAVKEAQPDTMFAEPVPTPIPDDRIDTIYYDNEWRRVSNQTFASYCRYALYPGDTALAKRCRTFYSTGELESEGNFVSLANDNDKNSVFDGKHTRYYQNGRRSLVCNYAAGKLDGEYVTYAETGKPTYMCHYAVGKLNGKSATYAENGRPKIECAYRDGQLDGEHTQYFDNGKPAIVSHYAAGNLDGLRTEYYESGLIKSQCTLKDGKKDGMESVFSENAETCTQNLYTAGQPSAHYTVTDKLGNSSTYSTADHAPVYAAPTEADLKTEYKNGVAWPYYNKNGIILGVSQTLVEDVGSYRELQFFLANNSMNNVDIDPAAIEAYIITKKDERKAFKFMAADEYDDKIFKKKKKKAKADLKGKKVVMLRDKDDNLNAALGATMFDESLNTVAAFQKRMVARKSLTEAQRIMADSEVTDLEYLQRTTVHPGEAVSGYLYIDDKKVDELCVDVTANGILYTYKWDLRKKKKD